MPKRPGAGPARAGGGYLGVRPCPVNRRLCAERISSFRHAARPLPPPPGRSRTKGMLSQKARYALRALVELARAEGAQLTAGELALRADAPRKFLEAILLELARNDLVVSRRGKFGGYLLARPAAEIAFAQVIRVVDGPLALAPCVSPRLGFRKCDDCPDLLACTLREALMRARDATAEVLEGYSLADAASGGAAEVQLAAI